MSGQNTYHDGNHIAVVAGVSSIDGKSIVLPWVDPISHRWLVDISLGGGTETPVGIVNGVNNIFTVNNAPVYIVVDGLVRFSGFGYTYSSGTITVDPLAPPTEYIQSIYAVTSAQGQVQSIVAGANISVDSSDPAHPIVSSTGGGFTSWDPTETPNSVITTFTFSSATAQPTYILQDGVMMKAVAKNGTINWTWNAGAKQSTQAIPPDSDIEAIK